MSVPEPSSSELASLSAAIQKLWTLDDNRLDPNEDYGINVQKGKSMWQKGDAAQEKLFKGVKKEVWLKPTFVIFYNLLDNYVTETGTAEVETTTEKKEQSDFIDACLKTRVMQYCHKYCAEKGMIGSSPADFKKALYQMWFSFYRRDGAGNDSCGFEHVFVGESKGDAVTGFHNWIQFYIQEAKGHVDYLGYVLPKGRGGDATDDEDRLLSVQFAWKGEEKSVSTFFVGTSPEFELALYTLCFLCGEEKNPIELGHYDLDIVCYRISSKYGDKIATAYPDLKGEDPTNRFAELTL